MARSARPLPRAALSRDPESEAPARPHLRWSTALAPPTFLRALVVRGGFCSLKACLSVRSTRARAPRPAGCSSHGAASLKRGCLWHAFRLSGRHAGRCAGDVKLAQNAAAESASLRQAVRTVRKETSAAAHARWPRSCSAGRRSTGRRAPLTSRSARCGFLVWRCFGHHVMCVVSASPTPTRTEDTRAEVLLFVTRVSRQCSPRRPCQALQALRMGQPRRRRTESEPSRGSACALCSMLRRRLQTWYRT